MNIPRYFSNNGSFQKKMMSTKLPFLKTFNNSVVVNIFPYRCPYSVIFFKKNKVNYTICHFSKNKNPNSILESRIPSPKWTTHAVVEIVSAEETAEEIYHA